MERKLTIKNKCYGMNEGQIIDNILDGRGIKDREHFLHPKEEDIYPYSMMKNIDEGVEKTLSCLDNGLSAFVHCDSDTDGVMSGAILIRYLKDLGFYVDWDISLGKSHGMTDRTITNVIDSGASILFVVDSLDGTVNNYMSVKNKGIEVVVLDHHDINPDIPYSKYVTLISSMNDYPNPELSGAGVTWKFCKRIDEIRGTDYADKYVDLACVGIIADVMDMSENSPENRAICNLGLHNKRNFGITKIIGSYEFNAKSIAFSIAPLINAACRLSENEVAQEAFLLDDFDMFKERFYRLKECREIQNKEINDMLPELMDDIENNQIKNKVLFAIIDTEHGISGLVASKLMDYYKRPVFVIKEDKNRYTGSCRSIGCGDFRELCNDTGKCLGLGHAEAFGVFINYEDIDAFKCCIEEEVREMELSQEYIIDVELGIEDITSDLIDKVKEINFLSGKNFPEISFKVSCDDYEISTLSQGKHLVVNTLGFQFIKWNAGSLLEEFEDKSILEENIDFIGTLDQGYIGRQFSKKMIVTDFI